MKAISLWQPHASALFAPDPDSHSSIKMHETRHWRCPDKCIGVRIAIHAALRDTAETRGTWSRNVFHTSETRWREAFRKIGALNYQLLPRGAIIGEVMFSYPIHTEHMEPTEADAIWGNFADGRWAWPVVSHKRYPNPIPCIGRQGFFNWNDQPPLLDQRPA